MKLDLTIRATLFSGWLALLLTATISCNVYSGNKCGILMYLDNSLSMNEPYSMTHPASSETAVSNKWSMLKTSVFALSNYIFSHKSTKKFLLYFLATPNHLASITEQIDLISELNEYSPENIKAMTWKYHDHKPKYPRANYISGMALLDKTLLNGLVNRDHMISADNAIHIIFINAESLKNKKTCLELETLFPHIKRRVNDGSNDQFLFVFINNEKEAIEIIKQQVDSHGLNNVIGWTSLRDLDQILLNEKKPFKKLLNSKPHGL